MSAYETCDHPRDAPPGPPGGPQWHCHGCGYWNPSLGRDDRQGAPCRTCGAARPMVEQSAFAAVDKARAEYDAAASAAALSSLDLEDAYMIGDPALKADADRKWRAAYAAEAKARARWLAAKRQVSPSFEQLLADPTMQFDTHGEVLASILAYGRNAVCMTQMEVRSGTASVGGVVPPSVYLCTRPKPCPEHASGDSPAPGGDA